MGIQGQTPVEQTSNRLITMIRQLYALVYKNCISHFHHNALSSKYSFNGCKSLSDSFATPWAVAHQAPLSMGFHEEQEIEIYLKDYWKGGRITVHKALSSQLTSHIRITSPISSPITFSWLDFNSATIASLLLPEHPKNILTPS